MLNALVGAQAALTADQLFATLDPTSRSVRLGDGQSAIMTDTVGFIHKLPHQLVDAFRATLEEVNRADVLLEVSDLSDAHLPEHRATVQLVLDELGAGEKPRLVAYNKADLVDPAASDGERPAPVVGEGVPVSALTGYGLDTADSPLHAACRALGGGRRGRAVLGRRVAGARSRAGHGRGQLSRARRAGPGSRRTVAGSGAPPRGRAMALGAHRADVGARSSDGPERAIIGT
jgi:hypothetical protein